MTPDKHDFKSSLSVQSNIVLTDKSQVENTGVCSVCLTYYPLGRGFSIMLLHCILFILSLCNSLNIWKSVKSIGQFTLIDDDVLQVIDNVDIWVVQNII
jgi:hypothetical protein